MKTRKSGSKAPSGAHAQAPSGQPSTRDIRRRYVLMTAIAAAFAGAVVYGVAAHVREQLHQESRIRVAALAATIAAGLPAEEIRGLRATEVEGGSEYDALRVHLVATRQANPEVRRVYALVPGKAPGLWRYALEADTDPSVRVHAGDPFDAGGRKEIAGAIRGPTAERKYSRDSGGSWLSGYAPIRDAGGRVLAIVGVDVGSRLALASEHRFLSGAAIAYVLALCGIVFTGFDRYQKRRLELERNRNIHVRLSIHRLAEVMTRSGAESDLARHALEAIAEATGFPHWALFKRDRDKGALVLFATRALNDQAQLELAPDPIGPEASSHASRAAFRREAVTRRKGDGSVGYAFAAAIPEIGKDPNVCAVPVVEHDETTAVLQCFAPASRRFGADDVTLIRWMAAQLGQGLKRIQLESRDQLLASYMRSTDEMLVGFDLDGLITYANPAALRALDSGELVCCTVQEIRFPAEVTVTKAVDRDGNEGAWVLVGRDISERRDREDEIQSRTEQLELINEQLQHANDGLAEANRTKNEFLANTSHELRTPLNAVIGFATLIEQGITESEGERTSFARSIRESAEHLLIVINDILDLAKVEAGKLELALEAGDATPTIMAAVEAQRVLALRKGIKLEVETPAEPLEMQLDPARLRQVLLNLLGNAVKFTDKGEVRIKAWRKPSPAEIHIVVEDTGIGIAKGDQSRLFVKFSQVDGSYKRRHQGTGLGLVITKSLVQRMGGRISMESEGAGFGTRVTCVFPVAQAGTRMRTERDPCLNES
ncbi:MAG: hypothetical protein E6K74_00755 [Candidatus Eisenbacteria bacterium]|uniref:histidine kinase n=1 Tax=Eiseniibacteriota bacterium TaxID=2212470 RepID=A0A538SXW8_UNCEI|nr:MAG: hypothetical protein E6K74_00755 [Candidatus Eisenbacteria bacterium]